MVTSLVEFPWKYIPDVQPIHLKKYYEPMIHDCLVALASVLIIIQTNPQVERVIYEETNTRSSLVSTFEA